MEPMLGQTLYLVLEPTMPVFLSSPGATSKTGSGACGQVIELA